MVTLRRRARPLETTPAAMGAPPDTNGEKSGYEKLREERIRENLQRMKQLGISDISLKLKSQVQQQTEKRVQKRSRELKPVVSQTVLSPPRRSSRLQNVTPVSYAELRQYKVESLQDVVIQEGEKPEKYTEEHEKLLGTYKDTWVLFVDGYDSDGNRIYDQVAGKTCHQCRQKTIGHRTSCSRCNLVQGQFCGDCLFTRYGENVLEANQNPNWICPVCRGICNCSLCRIKKGWAPTGQLYRKVFSLGFKSVAHYLIQTRRTITQAEDSVPEHSVKKSLPFTDMNDTSQVVVLTDSNNLCHDCPNESSENNAQFKETALNVSSHVNLELENKGSKKINEENNVCQNYLNESGENKSQLKATDFSVCSTVNLKPENKESEDIHEGNSLCHDCPSKSSENNAQLKVTVLNVCSHESVQPENKRSKNVDGENEVQILYVKKVPMTPEQGKSGNLRFKTKAVRPSFSPRGSSNGIASRLRSRSRIC